jgi:hypothetical protein
MFGSEKNPDQLSICPVRHLFRTHMIRTSKRQPIPLPVLSVWGVLDRSALSIACRPWSRNHAHSGSCRYSQEGKRSTSACYQNHDQMGRLSYSSYETEFIENYTPKPQPVNTALTKIVLLLRTLELPLNTLVPADVIKAGK